MDNDLPAPHPDHDQYVIGLRNRESGILDKIYQKCFEEVVHWMIKNGLPEEEAKDRFQDAIIVLLENVTNESFVLTCSIKSYVYGICRNKIRQFYRTKERFWVRISQATHLYEEEGDLPGIAEASERIVQWHTLLRRTFSQLDERCQQIFNLVVDKVAADKIAETLEMTEANAVYQARFRCRRSWRKLIQKDQLFNACKPEGW